MASKKSPQIVLVGNFPDQFLEGIHELGFDFKLHKSSKALNAEKADIVMIGADRTDEVVDYVVSTGGVPVVSSGASDFSDYDPISEEGNAFIYSENSPWHLLSALIRAVETFKFTYDWRSLKYQVQDTVDELAAVAT